MKENKFFNPKKSVIPLTSFVLVVLMLAFSACEKKDEVPGFTADFSFEFLDDNHVKFQNLSEGEYYSLIWNFGNGTADTTTNKKKSYQVYYPEAGDFEVSLKLTNYTGSNKTTTKLVSVATNDLTLSFTAEVLPDNPNLVLLTNTTEGSYDSFKWLYHNIEVEDEMVHEAYFPFAGNYEVELLVSKNNFDFSLKQTVNITQDDPGNLPGLIWSDEFDYTGLPDPSKWNMETGGGGWGNNELQYYTNSENNAMVDNGILTITAREEPFGGRDYTSARITTQNKFDFKYGKIEARIKLPYGQGMWPAFWMLGTNISSVGWPACGETDIMELVGGTGKDNTCHATLHWDHDGEDASYGQSYTLPSGIFADDFHLFSVKWDTQEIKGYMDGIHYYTADILPSQLSEFHNNFFIILNLAVGGSWPGPPNASTTFPQTMEVDYVRVYQD
nr:family 16 glycosylhydrolase [Bacteroidota bacterium]